MVVYNDETEGSMSDCRPQDFSRVCNGFVHGSFGNIESRDATEPGIQKNDTDDLLMKGFHLEIGFVDRLGVVQRSRQSVLSFSNVRNPKGCHDCLSSTSREELTQFP